MRVFHNDSKGKWCPVGKVMCSHFFPSLWFAKTSVFVDGNRLASADTSPLLHPAPCPMMLLAFYDL